ncbi:hypothetical protein [Thermosynechococcus sp.]|uniref:hypothetical protein n=1 Tax=Thermosynechococcus sp. TaxID=2814275 RepID=UPI002624AC3C|nr:hypothetical protein [Thermosynechococcus sp.]
MSCCRGPNPWRLSSLCSPELYQTAQSLGLTLREIKAVEVYDRGEIPCDPLKEKLEEKSATSYRFFNRNYKASYPTGDRPPNP